MRRVGWCITTRQYSLRLASETEEIVLWLEALRFQPASKAKANRGARTYRRICRGLFGWPVGEKLSPARFPTDLAQRFAWLNLNCKVRPMHSACHQPDFRTSTPVAAALLMDGRGRY
jgi:hypothetical protein